MGKHPSIASPGQEQHMRDMLDRSRTQRGQTLSAFSQTLIGSMRLLDFQRGAPLTSMLLSRVIIGFKAEGVLLTREVLLGPDEPPPVPVAPAESEESCPGPPEALLTCVQCLTEALTELTTISRELTPALTAVLRAIQEAAE